MGINFTLSFELYSTLRSSLLNYSTLNLCTIKCHIQHVGIYNYTSVHGHIMLIQPGWFLACSSDIWSCRRICCHREWREVSRWGPRSCGRNLPLPDSVAWSVLRCVVCVFYYGGRECNKHHRRECPSIAYVKLVILSSLSHSILLLPPTLSNYCLYRLFLLSYWLIHQNGLNLHTRNFKTCHKYYKLRNSQPSKVVLVMLSERGPSPGLVTAATDTVYSVNGSRPTHVQQHIWIMHTINTLRVC